MLILGIETSCDETSVSCVENGKKIHSVVTATQLQAHSLFGGVVPEIASRIHAETLGQVTHQALDKAGTTLKDISFIAATSGPGLLGSLLVGVSFANALAISARKKCISINHLEAHMYSAFMEFEELRSPVIALLVSGGHTVLILMRDFGEYRTLGSTLDDAAGEAFDKIAFFLDLGFPGGPAVEKAAKKGNCRAFDFPRAMIKHKRRHDFSFSGLKTAVINKVRSIANSPEDLSGQTRYDIAASFQEAVVDTLVKKTIASAEEEKVTKIILAGGVAANNRLRDRMSEACVEKGFKLYTPPVSLCGDNAAMVAGLAYHKKGFAVDYIDDISAVKSLS